MIRCTRRAGWPAELGPSKSTISASTVVLIIGRRLVASHPMTPRTRNHPPSRPPASAAAYLRQTPFSSPGAYEPLFEGLPADVDGLSRVVQGLVVHYRSRQVLRARLPKRRLLEVNTRYVDRMLSRLMEMSPSPLTESRPVPQRIVGCCRDFATLFTAMARHQGIPCRIRVGFASYFSHAPAGYWIDHTIAEYWKPRTRTWTLVDPEQSEALVRENRLDFDPADVPRDQFIVGGRAWQMCRHEGADPELFCVEPKGPPRGLWFVRTRLILDLAALNREELLLWDGWGPMAPDASLSGGTLGKLDRLADALSRSTPKNVAVRGFYREPGLRHPARVYCFSPVCPPYRETLRSSIPDASSRMR